MEGRGSCSHQTKIARLRRGKQAWDHGNIAESGFRVSGPGVGRGEHHYQKVLESRKQGEQIAEVSERSLFAILLTRRFGSFQALLHHICIEHAVLLQIMGNGVLR